MIIIFNLKAKIGTYSFIEIICSKVEQFCFYTSNHVVEMTHIVKALMWYLKKEVFINKVLLFWLTALVFRELSNVGHQNLVNKPISLLKKWQKFVNFKSNQRNHQLKIIKKLITDKFPIQWWPYYRDTSDLWQLLEDGQWPKSLFKVSQILICSVRMNIRYGVWGINHQHFSQSF